MNKADLLDAISSKVGGEANKKAINHVLDAFQEVVADTLAKGDRVTIPNFGTFESRSRAARRGRNPKTGEIIQIAASKAPAFKAGKEFRLRSGGTTGGTAGKTAGKATGKTAGKTTGKTAGK